MYLFTPGSLSLLITPTDTERNRGVLAVLIAGCLLLSGCGGLSVNPSSSASTASSAIVPSTTDVIFGTADIGQSVSSDLSISNPSTQPIQIAQLSVSGSSFSITGQTPSSFTIAAGATVGLSLGFNPSAVGDSDGDLSVMGADASATPLARIHLHGTGSPILKAVSCTQASITGAGTDACTVALNYPAQKNVTVSLTSSASAVSVPQSVTIPAGSASVSVTATVAAVTTAQSATISATTSGQTVTFPIQLSAASPSLTVSSLSVDFGSIVQGQTGTQTVTLLSAGTLPVTIASLSISTASFTSSGVSTPLTLNPGQTASVSLLFTAPSAGTYTAALAIGSNSSSGNLSVNLTAASVAAATLKSLSCGSASMTGAGTDACTVTLTGAAPTGGIPVSLSSSNSAVTVPSSVTVPAGSASVSATATVAAVTSSQTAVLSASAVGTTQTFSLQLSATNPTLKSLSCTTTTMSAAGSDACTVTLTAPALAGGLSVSLSSNNAAVTVPSSVTVAANGTSAAFTATVAAFTSAQTATLTATGGGASANLSLQLSPPQKTLSVNATTVSFGNVVINDAATQSIVLSSTGNAAVTVNSATLTGAGFTDSGITFPLTLNAGQTATLNMQFDPAATGAVTGQLTLASNSSTGTTTIVSLSGTGQPHEVQLAWSGPIQSSDPVSGYRIYRASTGSSTYQRLNSTLDAQTSYKDSTGQTGASYQYYVTSVDSSGVESVPSNTAIVTIP